MKPLYAPPLPSRRMWRLTLRNFLVWRKLIFASVVVHFIEPVIVLVGFGVGIGAMIGEVGDGSYLEFIAAGIVGYGAMNSASFEALYSAFTRMHVQRTWEGILNAPMTLDDVLLGEWLWATAKGSMAGTAILLVLTLLGLAPPATLLPVGVVIILTAAAFSGIGLAVNAPAPNYEFFSYYFSLFIVPMMMLSGAFFPTDILPPPLQTLSSLLPLTHSVNLIRALLTGEVPLSAVISIMWLVAYALIGLYIAAILTRRRLLR